MQLMNSPSRTPTSSFDPESVSVALKSSPSTRQALLQSRQDDNQCLVFRPLKKEEPNRATSAQADSADKENSSLRDYKPVRSPVVPGRQSRVCYTSPSFELRRRRPEAVTLPNDQVPLVQATSDLVSDETDRLSTATDSVPVCTASTHLRREILERFVDPREPDIQRTPVPTREQETALVEAIPFPDFATEAACRSPVPFIHAARFRDPREPDVCRTPIPDRSA
eukprot:CAMPEP_0114545294 /NCGR_PEP_ID=MMETSP0114-20121206/3323_1 /TAXON_ID=31324 /ORGANISM="Goniomonas sp, Strain m" /LENGTH=223 /DNA_ID=CAMNT_0001729711 /DNA_START=46 /DNA_END=717 /DNA_ORIENTATION=+